MNIKNWMRLFVHTLFIGGIITVICGFTIQWEQYAPLFRTIDVKEIAAVSSWLLGVGFIFSVISQMGYFAYLTVHRIGLGFFRSLWNPVQIVIIAFILFDLVYFRYRGFAEENESLFPYFSLALFLLAAGMVTAYVKARQTGWHAFVPALFLMTVVTVVEWFPVLRTNDADWLFLMLIPLLICNAYQLLALPRYIERAREERQERLAVNKETRV